MKIKIVKIFELKPNDIVNDGTEEFNALLDYLKTLEFRDSDCSHTNWDCFPSCNQGGSNMVDINNIAIINETPWVLTIKVEWLDDLCGGQIAIVSFNK